MTRRQFEKACLVGSKRHLAVDCRGQNITQIERIETTIVQ